MRLYSIVNMYMQGIHAGIQTAHAVHTLAQKYDLHTLHGEDIPARGVYERWVENHKTIYVKRGGDHEGLESLYTRVRPLCKLLGLPHVKWRESNAALRGATTAIGIVIPSDVYDYSYTGPMMSLGNGHPLDRQYIDEKDEARDKLNSLICNLPHAS